MAAGFDRTSIAGKEFPLAGQSQLVVIGAGSAGVAAAIEAAKLGLSVTLIDEHPVASGLIGLDVPYMVGERMTAAIQNQARMVEQIAASRPDIADAFEAGVDVQMGISAWAAFVEGPTSRALPGRMLALADEGRSSDRLRADDRRRRRARSGFGLSRLGPARRDGRAGLRRRRDPL